MDEATKFNRKDLAQIVADSLHIPLSSADNYCDEVLSALKDMLCADSKKIKIELRGFGTFTVKPAKARDWTKTIQSKEAVYVPEHKKMHFKPGKEIKRFLMQPLNKEDVPEGDMLEVDPEETLDTANNIDEDLSL